jgi:hypothetical protein
MQRALQAEQSGASFPSAGQPAGPLQDTAVLAALEQRQAAAAKQLQEMVDAALKVQSPQFTAGPDTSMSDA